MKKRIMFLFTIILTLIAAPNLFAVPVEFTYTADNEIINVWYQYGSTTVSVPLGSEASNWSQADSFTLNLKIGTKYQIIWQARDWTWEGNPGGFLGEVNSPAKPIVDSLLSSAKWEVAFLKGNLGVPDWSTLVWGPATEYGANNDPSTIWYKAFWGPVSGISGEAQWIWTALNFDDPGCPQTGDSVFIRVTVEPTTPVPEPATMLLFGIGLLGLGTYSRRLRNQ